MISEGMGQSWPHAPLHYFARRGTYMITAGTHRIKVSFESDAARIALRKLSRNGKHRNRFYFDHRLRDDKHGNLSHGCAATHCAA